MPELPEVETIKNEILPYVVGHRITGITLLWEGMVRHPAVSEFLSRVTGQEITGISRRGKYLLFSLTSSDLLVIHLKMTGSLIIGKNSSEPPRFTRAIIHLDGDTSIFFRDPRKFGIMQLLNDRSSIKTKLGPEPLETGFNPELLARRLLGRKAPIKALLCDQGFIAGIGNMYADESLFASHIHPLRPGGSLSPEEVERLYHAIRQVLLAAIGNKGASTDTYFRPDGTRGTAHFEFNVAHGRGKLCPICDTPIERIVVRNRGTYFCPKCQPI
ncbi:MAG: bifunctional DNA-formamidopyrimidine glycosylase/DNA-(apurinic or apyrimidinic site) lyase [Dehalococcoidales bacterium]|nr:MAG: bifunctional DNA-formamidopyrimidine glycosylase/DNA-(apurinic or apyrimidinic site) lyase [Dehalococcoidales bacterium]